MGQKTKRLISYEGGYLIKPTLLTEPKTSHADRKLACENLTKRTGFPFMQGNIFAYSKSSSTPTTHIFADIHYPIDNKTNQSSVGYVNNDTFFANFAEKTTNNSKDMMNQSSGVCHAIDSCNNTQKNTDNNGYCIGYRTRGDGNDYHTGASPMPIVGLQFKVWCIQGSSNEKYWYNEVKVNQNADSGSDCFINKVHLVYITPEGNIYSRLIKPEGNNTGPVKFYLKDKLSDNYDNLSQHKGKQLYGKHNAKNCLKVRAWHDKGVPVGDCLMGFFINWGIGSVANKHKWHNIVIGGVTPILEGDLLNISTNEADVKPARTAVYMPPLKSKADLYNYFPELSDDADENTPKTRKLWTVSDGSLSNDPNISDANFKTQTSQYISSYSWKAGNMEKFK